MAAWLALRVVSKRKGLGRSDRLEAPFVGRDEELRLLKDLFHATAREQRARLVSITGQAGIGKSRLAWEFLKYVDGVVEGVWWHDGRSPAYGEGVTFWALGEMIRSRAGLLETDDTETTRTKVAEMLATHVPGRGRTGLDRALDARAAGRRRCPGRAAATSCSVPGGPSSNGWRRPAPSASCSRTSSGRMPVSSTSSTTCSSGAAASRS